MRRSVTVLGSLALPLVLLAACSANSDGSTPTAGPATIGLTTVPPAATTATDVDSTVTGTEAPATTEAGAGPVYLLTGLPVTDPAAAARPALVVKIDNHPKARPQTGLGVADIVFEENVEGITRFAAVFHSQGSDPVGPIRSGRTQDVALLGSFVRPLFAWSGGNPSVEQAISDSDVVDLSALKNWAYEGGGFYRSDRPGPHDLYAQCSMLWTLAPDGAAPPLQQFSYRAAGETPSGESSAGVHIGMDGVDVDWTYDAVTDRYLREQNEKAHNDTTTGQIAASNVVVLIVRYAPSPADARSPEAQTLGDGEVIVFSGGKRMQGTWERADRLEPFTLRDASGEVIELTPGNTWVELARSGTVADLAA